MKAGISRAPESKSALERYPTAREQIGAAITRLFQTDWTPWLIVALAAALRLFLLGIKPPHFDEGINGWFVDQMVKTGYYRYDPTNYHGPLHFYVLFVWLTLFGRNLWALRLPVVLLSVMAVWLTTKFEPLVGRTVARWAALAMAVSPAFVFYGRYSIHEAWLVFFSMLFILGVLGLWRFGARPYLWCAGMGVTGMILTKETYLIHIACAIVAGLVCYISNLLSPVGEPQGGIARSVFRAGPKPILQGIELPLLVHALSAACLLTATLASTRWRDHLILLAVVGLASAFFLPMKLFYGKAVEREEVLVISGRWVAAFFFSICAQSALFLPRPWSICLCLIAPLGIVSAFRIRADRVFVVQYDAIDLLAVVTTGVISIVFFYSGTFFHWGGLTGLIEAYNAWFATGTEGHGHEKPPDYWIRLIGRYELPIVLGLVMCLFCQRLKNISLRYLAIYGVGTLIAYSIVRYKTPWCIVSIVWPLLFAFAAGILLTPLRLRLRDSQILISVLLVAAGVAIWFAVSKNYDFVWPFLFLVALPVYLVALRHRTALLAVQSIALATSLGWTVWLNYFRCTTDTEPYVYVQTYNDIFKLTRPLLTLARRDPRNYQMIGHLIRTSSYPLPWMLGDFTRVGYYEHETLPATLDADFLLVQSDRIKEIEGKLHQSYYTEPLTIRPYQDTSKVYFEANRFKDFFPGRVPDFTGKGPG